jgi:hypothetical protein
MIFKLKIKQFLLLILLIGTILVNAQEKGIAPKYSNEFLQIGVGADALARGNAVVAGVEGSTALYWNPAALTLSKSKFDISGMHSDYFAGLTKYDFIGFSTKVNDKTALGLSFIRFGVDNIPNTTQLIDKEGNIDFDRITLFSAADYAFNFSYAKKLALNGLSIGGTAKVIHRKVGDMAKSWGFGLDFSALYTPNEKVKVGLMLRDATSTFNAWSFSLDQETKDVFTATGNALPSNGLELTLPRILIGGQYKQPFGTKGSYLAGELDTEITTDGKRNVLLSGKPFSLNPNIGLEFGFKNLVFVRSGVQNFQYVTDNLNSKKLTFQPSVGMGVLFQGIRLDYAFTDIGDISTAMYSHVFSLRISFNSFSSNL